MQTGCAMAPCAASLQGAPTYSKQHAAQVSLQVPYLKNLQLLEQQQTLDLCALAVR